MAWRRVLYCQSPKPPTFTDTRANTHTMHRNCWITKRICDTIQNVVARFSSHISLTPFPSHLLVHSKPTHQTRDTKTGLYDYSESNMYRGEYVNKNVMPQWNKLGDRIHKTPTTFSFTYHHNSLRLLSLLRTIGAFCAAKLFRSRNLVFG